MPSRIVDHVVVEFGESEVHLTFHLGPDGEAVAKWDEHAFVVVVPSTDGAELRLGVKWIQEDQPPQAWVWDGKRNTAVAPEIKYGDSSVRVGFPDTTIARDPEKMLSVHVTGDDANRKAYSYEQNAHVTVI